MKGNDGEEIGKVIGRFVREESLECGVNEGGVMKWWGEVLGGVIGCYRGEVYIKNEVV